MPSCCLSKAARCLRFFAVVLSLLAGTAHALPYTATTSGNWSSPATWGGSGPPGAGDTATISSAVTVTLDTNVTIATFNMSAGTLAGANALTVDGASTWSGGTLAATLIIPSTRTLDLNGGVKTVSTGANLQNSGTATWTAGNLESPTFNTGTLNNLSGGSFDAQADVSWTALGCCSQAGTFNNAGTFRQWRRIHGES